MRRPVAQCLLIGRRLRPAANSGRQQADHAGRQQGGKKQAAQVANADEKRQIQVGINAIIFARKKKKQDSQRKTSRR